MKRLGIWYQVTLLIGGIMVSWRSSPTIAAKTFLQHTSVQVSSEAFLANYFENEELPPVLSALARLDSIYKIMNVKPMQGGYSTRVFSLITISQRKFVLRVLPKRDSSQEFSKEIYAAIANAKKKTGPKIFYSDSINGILVMEHLGGQVLRDSVYEDTHNKIFELAKLLKQSHSIPAFQLAQYNIYSRIYDTLRSMGISVPKRLVKLVDVVKKIEQEPSLWPQVPCHNDLNPNNILESHGKLWLIDWEMAGLNDPFYDLATLANFMALNPTQQKEFLKAYLGGESSQQQLKRFAQMRLVSLTFYGTILQKIAQEPIFFEFDQLDEELVPLANLYERKQVWNQFNDTKALSLFGLSLLAEAEKIASHLMLQ
ncbi:MAG: phosphotransferase [Oligoflexales bacterium]